MSKMDLPKPHDAVTISDLLGNINSKLRVAAMAVKGVAAENHDEDAFAISNMILDACEEIDEVTAEIRRPMTEEKVTELKTAR